MTRYGNKASTPRPTVEPDDVQIAWAAGFIEGEGSFRTHSNCQEVSAAQNDPECLYRLQAYFGGKVYNHKHSSPSGSIYKWTVTGGMAREAMALLRPLLSVRRQAQIDKALGQDTTAGVGSQGN